MVVIKGDYMNGFRKLLLGRKLRKWYKEIGTYRVHEVVIDGEIWWNAEYYGEDGFAFSWQVFEHCASFETAHSILSCKKYENAKKLRRRILKERESKRNANNNKWWIV